MISFRPDRFTPSLFLAFISITLIATFFRFYHLADHPLGLFFDPAINGLDAIRLMQRGGPVLFFPTNGGREALLIYLLIPFLHLFGTNPFSFRLQLAIISLLTVVFLFAFLSDSRLVAGLKLANNKNSFCHASRSRFAAVWFAALASLTLAVSYWHISISRLDQRPLTVPLLSIPIFWFFLEGWINNRRRWFVLSGLAMGLSFYTYSAARLLPIILVLTFLPEWLLVRRLSGQTQEKVSRFRPHLSGILLFIAVTLFVAAPILWYFAAYPTQFSARAASVMIWQYLDTPTDIIAELGRNTWRVLLFFCCSGNSNAIFGLPEYPGLPFLLTPFLIIGLAAALKNWRNLFFRLVALWWLIGIFPSIIAIEAPHPLRMIVAVVPTAILVALGLYASRAGSRLVSVLVFFQNLSAARPPLPPRGGRNTNFPLWGVRSGFAERVARGAGSQSEWRVIASLLLPFVIVLATIPGVFSVYFIRWPRLPITQGIYDYGAIAVRDAVLEQANPTRPIYLPLARFNDAPLLYYLSGTYRRQAALSAPPASDALVISPEKNEQNRVWVRLQGETATLLPPLTTEGQMMIQTVLSKSDTTPIRTAGGEIVARLAVLPTDPVRFVEPMAHSLNVAFGPARLIGATYPAKIDPGDGKLPVTLFWQATAQMVDEYEVLLQLVDDNRRVWGDGTARPNDWVYPTTFWRPGLDTIAAEQTVSLGPETLAPGRYWLAVSLYYPPLSRRLPLTEGVSDSPDTFFIGPLKVPLPPPTLAGKSQGKVVGFGHIAQLLSFQINPSQVIAGESLQLNLLWEALDPAPVDYTVFVHLLDADGRLVAGNDAQPVNNSYPTTLWSPGERILDPHTLPIPNDLPPGRYRLFVGLYDPITSERVPVIADTSGENAVLLETINLNK